LVGTLFSLNTFPYTIKGKIMNFAISALKSATFLTAASAALWIGAAAAQPLPLSNAGGSGALYAAIPRGQALVDPTDEVDVDLSPNLHRQMVDYPTKFAAGTVIIDTDQTYLYYVLGGDKAIRYGIGVGRDGFRWSGQQSVTRKAEWPDWIPPHEMIERQPYLARFMAGGEGNPLGARAIYLGNTVYRIHGTNMPATIGKKMSSGCIRMLNADVIDLYNRVDVGTKIVVLPSHNHLAKIAAPASVLPTRIVASQGYNPRVSSIY
jgi:lipoprotein-anchoring transpeptidase ErfK/SrfK